MSHHGYSLLTHVAVGVAGPVELTGTVEVAAETTAVAEQIHEAAATLEASAETTADATLIYETVGTVEAAAETTGTATQTHVQAGTVEAAAETRSASKHLDLDGSSGNFASTPTTAVLDITGDIWLAGRPAHNDWTVAFDQAVIGKWVTSGNQRSYRLEVEDNANGNVLRLSWSTDGTGPATVEVDSTVAPTAANGERLWVAGTLDASTGDVKFYTGGSGDAPIWVQLGTTISGSGATSIFAGTAPVEVGTNNNGADSLLKGKVYNAQIENGYDVGVGTLVANFNAEDFQQGDTDTDTAVDSTGLTWTINGTGAAIKFGPAFTQIHKPAGTIEAAAETTAVAESLHELAATLEAAAETTANATQFHELAATLEAAAESTAAATQIHEQAATVEAAAETTATLRLIFDLVAALEAVAEATGTPAQTHRLAAVVEAAAEAAGTPTQISALVAAVEVAIEVAGAPSIAAVATTKGGVALTDELVSGVALTDELVSGVGLTDELVGAVTMSDE